MSWMDPLLFGYNLVQAAGSPLVARRTLNFISAAVADDPANNSTDITVAASGTGSWWLVVPLTGASGPTYTSTIYTGSVLYTMATFSDPFVFKMPVSSHPPTAGMVVGCMLEDQSWTSTNNLTFNGNGVNMNYGGASTATVAFTPQSGGNGFAISWTFTGSIWVVSP